MKRNSLQNIAVLCAGELVGVDSWVESVVSDSRNVSFSSNALFVAIRGLNHDGHAYVAEMYARGVRAFIVERGFAIENFPEAGFVVADNTLKALQRWASGHRDKFKGKVIGITGSNGKTVVKEWIAQLLGSSFKVFRSPKSYNSQLGVALSLLMLQGDEDLAIIEAGISQCGEMDALREMIKPDLGVITTLGEAHQENFVSLESKLEEKLKLFTDCKAVFYNSEYEIIKSYVKANFIDVRPYYSHHCPFVDGASVQNVAMCVAVLDYLGVEDYDLSKLEPVAMRLELKEGLNNSLIINDAYNSDINSLAIALDYFATVSGDKPRVVILSDILQSGLNSSELYLRVAELVKQYKIDLLIGIGSQISSQSHLFDCRKEFYSSVEQFLSSLNSEHTSSKAILIKGNRNQAFERLSYALELKNHTTILEVDLNRMVENLNYYRSKLIKGSALMAMVKASAYGHGGREIALALQHEGVDYLAVAFADEGVELRRGGVNLPVVVLNADADSFEVMISSALEPEIYNFWSLESFITTLRSYGELSYPVHLKFDTGMGRLGFRAQDMDVLCDVLRENSDVIRVKTMFSHLAVADDELEDEFTLSQLALFNDLHADLSSRLGYRPMAHIANSAAIERFPEAHLDMCRLGIGLYTHSFISALKTRVVHVKDMSEGDSVGYGREFVLDRDMKIATIPIGYADGLDRHLGCGNWNVRIGVWTAPIVGRICMDTCMIDISDIPQVKIGDTVEIFSANKGNTLDDMAEVLSTISYEIMCSVSSRVKRIYIKE